jgi:hypothetical protein
VPRPLADDGDRHARVLHQRQGGVPRVVQSDPPQPSPPEQAAELVGVPLRIKAARCARREPAPAPQPLPWEARPGARRPLRSDAADQPGLLGTQTGTTRAVPRRSIVPLAAAAYRPLPAVASLRDGCASLDPAPTRQRIAATRKRTSPGSGQRALICRASYASSLADHT